MAQAFNKVNSFVEAVAEKTHNLGSDQLKIALTNTDPTSSCTNYSDITLPIADTNLEGLTPFNVTTSTSSQTAGTYKLVCADLTLTATGEVGPFRYVVLYNDDAISDEVVGYYDYSLSITLQSGDTFKNDFSQDNGVLIIS
jgi:hypothetical protein